MLKLNDGMMQFAKSPFHRNDASFSNSYVAWLFSGGDLTPTEIDFIKNNPSGTGLFNFDQVQNHLRLTRTQLGHTADPGAAPSIRSGRSNSVKANGSSADETVWKLSREPGSFYIIEGGTVGLLYIAMYSANTGNTRTIFVGTVGDLNSNADVKIADPVLVQGTYCRINDFKFRIANLLG